ncbi:hypothetical protein MMC14_001224 [Varicellaria rhodocarpa]|nr:hypothetical protein [Varicellaria rhodocarpa]
MPAIPPMWLLLLPKPPSDISLAAIRAAYEPSLSEILHKAAVASQTSDRVCLDIAVSYPLVTAYPTRSRTVYYSRTERLIGLLYRIICLVCTERFIDVEFSNDFDVCVILVGSGEDENRNFNVIEGPVIDLQTLAQSQRPWSYVHSVESEVGESLLKKFINMRKSIGLRAQLCDFSIHRVSGGTSISTSGQGNSAESESQQSADTRHYSIAVGGTFDHLHAGHKLLLTATAALLEPQLESEFLRKRCLTIGITGDELLTSKRYAAYLQSWEERQSAVYQFLLSVVVFSNLSDTLKRIEHFTDTSVPNGMAVHYEFSTGLTIKCVEISDPFGPTITDESITALVISGETRAGGKAVNDKRTSKGWWALEVFEVDVLDQSTEGQMEEIGKDFQGKISSTDIRRRLQERKQST